MTDISAPPVTTSEPVQATIVTPSPSKSEEMVSNAPVQIREIVAIGLMVVLADATLYRGHGYAGIGAFLIIAPLIFLTGLPRFRINFPTILAGALLVIVVGRMVWLGSPLRVVSAACLLSGLSIAVQGGRIDIRSLILVPLQAVPSGLLASGPYAMRLRRSIRFFPKGLLLSIGLPALALIGFGTIFILANPDVVEFVGNRLERFFQAINDWLARLTLQPTEIMFWLFVALISAGFFRPFFGVLIPRSSWTETADRIGDDHPRQTPLYPAIRNTLIAVIALFSAYLVFEFQTLWFRDFPDGFYYAGYAHEGAFWLTMALALATGLLSLVFRGPTLGDPRIATLRRLAWGWCSLNGLLAIAVYNRMFIYVDYNGLTHLRIVGMFGIAAVIAGLILVVWKIIRQRDFAWLLGRQLWALTITVFLYAITPVDAIAVAYNVQRIMEGDSSATMQIGVQSIDTEGVLALSPLLDCDDMEIRAGVRALMAERFHNLRNQERRRRDLGWTTRQFADDVALGKLEKFRNHWMEFDDRAARESALQRFYDYAYQWY